MKDKQDVFFDEAVDPYWPDNKDFPVKAEHLMRYYFARSYLRSKIKNINCIYDFASGGGYGEKILSPIAHKVIGFDKEDKYIEYANERYKLNNTLYIQVNLDVTDLSHFISEKNLPKPDAVTSFETIEHLENPNYFLSNISKILNEGAYLICSVPNEAYEPKKNNKPLNKHHKHLFTKEDIINLLRFNNFEIVEVLGQPYPNMIIHYLGKHLKAIDKFVFKSTKRFERVARIFAYPTRFFNAFTYSYVIVARKENKS